ACSAPRAGWSDWRVSGWKWPATRKRRRRGCPLHLHPRPPSTPMPTYSGELRPVAGARYAIVASRWNPRIVDALVDGALRTLADHGVGEEAIDLVRVPGAWEIPQAALRLATRAEVAAILALGCVVRGDTRHYE